MSTVSVTVLSIELQYISLSLWESAGQLHVKDQRNAEWQENRVYLHNILKITDFMFWNMLSAVFVWRI